MTNRTINNSPEPLDTELQTLELTGQQQLLVQHHPGGDMVQFLDRSGAIMLTVMLTEHGPVLRFEGDALTLQTAGSLAIEAEHLNLHGRRGASVTSGGELHVTAVGDLHSQARSHEILATEGDVRLRANDDVKLTGERIRMNC
jgi:hypothetical protein